MRKALLTVSDGDADVQAAEQKPDEDFYDTQTGDMTIQAAAQKPKAAKRGRQESDSGEESGGGGEEEEGAGSQVQE
eukprot:51105-Eustigmatos_ZCMA.PRE.1